MSRRLERAGKSIVTVFCGRPLSRNQLRVTKWGEAHPAAPLPIRTAKSHAPMVHCLRAGQWTVNFFMQVGNGFGPGRAGLTGSVRQWGRGRGWKIMFPLIQGCQRRLNPARTNRRRAGERRGFDSRYSAGEINSCHRLIDRPKAIRENSGFILNITNHGQEILGPPGRP
jgi:hypothetical protein